MAEYRQQVGTDFRWIFLDEALHLGGPLYAEQAVSLAPTVDEMPLAEVALAQEGHVDKAHASQIG